MCICLYKWAITVHSLHQFGFVDVVPDMEPTVLHMLGKCSASEPHPLSPSFYFMHINCNLDISHINMMNSL